MMKLSDEIRTSLDGDLLSFPIDEWADKVEQFEVENDALKQMELRVGICEWELDEDSDTWMTSCSNAWVFTNDGPKENECHYCMYCGGILEALQEANSGV